jgi:hypothetical protein
MVLFVYYNNFIELTREFDFKTNKLAIPDVLPLVNAYALKKGNSLGGVLHLFLSNKNIERSHIEFCLNQAKDKDDTDGAHLANLLLQMSKTQRLKICNQWRCN